MSVRDHSALPTTNGYTVPGVTTKGVRRRAPSAQNSAARSAGSKPGTNRRSLVLAAPAAGFLPAAPAAPPGRRRRRRLTAARRGARRRRRGPGPLAQRPPPPRRGAARRRPDSRRSGTAWRSRLGRWRMRAPSPGSMGYGRGPARETREPDRRRPPAERRAHSSLRLGSRLHRTMPHRTLAPSRSLHSQRIVIGSRTVPNRGARLNGEVGIWSVLAIT